MKNSANTKPRLIALNGETNPQPISINLEEGESFTFGRNPVCDLPVRNVAVSRQHCRITREAENFNLEDLGSHNGTFVNDLPVNVQRLEHGDQIRVGNSYFMFLIDENDAPLDEAQFDDGSLVTNSVIQLFPSDNNADFSTDSNVLIKLGKAIKETEDVETLQRKILEIVLEFIPARRGAILLSDDDLEAIRAVCVSARGHAETELMQISRTVSERVLREQVALLSNDLSDKNLEQAESLIASRVSSLLCVPLKIGESSKGLIYLDASDPHVRFTENHLEQMTALSFLVSAALANAESMETLRQENAILKDNLQIETNMIGESQLLKDVFRLISRVAPTDSTVLIAGESGTGKELVAKAIHQNSVRRAKSFVAINCAALNESLLESELFGHEKGAFTGALAQKRGKLEIADGGTVFLDEIGELTPAIQVKLLRVLQEREFERVGGTKTIKVNVRVIAATNRSLEEEVKSGKFRRDLFFRLNVVQIKVPPLRERKSDIPLLAQHFVHKYSERCHRNVVGLSREAQKILLECEWQGNVRELENVIERAVVLGTTDKVLPDDLPNEMVENAAPHLTLNGDFYAQLKLAKQKIVTSALQSANGNYTEAARLLGIHPNNLHRIIRELGIKDELRTMK